MEGERVKRKGYGSGVLTGGSTILEEMGEQTGGLHFIFLQKSPGGPVVDLIGQAIQELAEPGPAGGLRKKSYFWNSGMKDEAAAHEAGFKATNEREVGQSLGAGDSAGFLDGMKLRMRSRVLSFQDSISTFRNDLAGTVADQGPYRGLPLFECFPGQFEYTTA